MQVIEVTKEQAAAMNLEILFGEKTMAKKKPVPKLKPASATKKEWWTVVWMPSNRPIVPYDANPKSDDEGLLVYRTKKAAELAADHQFEMYGDMELAVAVPLSSVK